MVHMSKQSSRTPAVLFGSHQIRICATFNIITITSIIIVIIIIVILVIIILNIDIINILVIVIIIIVEIAIEVIYGSWQPNYHPPLHKS